MSDLESVAPEAVYHFTRAQYERLVEQGEFNDARVELLRGVLVKTNAQGVWHLRVTGELHALLLKLLGDSVFVTSHSPVALSDDSEPEPDVAVHPRETLGDTIPGQPALLVEVSDSSLSRDGGIKRSLYSEAGVPEYWIVRRDTASVEVYTEPSPAGFQREQVYGPTDSIRLQAFPEVEVPIAEFWLEGFTPSRREGASPSPTAGVDMWRSVTTPIRDGL